MGSTNWITAAASNNWVFTGWSDGTTDNPHASVVESNRTYMANFAPAVTVATVALPPEGGWTAGDGVYAIGSTATVTATATNGWVFLNWNGAITNNSWAFAVLANATVCTANFGQISTVTGLANPTNAGSVTGGGVYLVGSNAVLTVTATNGWQFSHWNDGATNNPYVIIVPETNITYTAAFAATAIITVGANPTNGGFATGGGIYLVGSTNWITAASSNGWVFTGWNDGVAANPHAIVVESNRTYTANFAPAAMVTTVALPPEGGWTAGDGPYVIGSTATVTATATNGWLFLNWNGTVINYTQTGNTNNPLGFRAAASITYTANFARVTADGFVYIVIPIANAKRAAKAGAAAQTVSIIGYIGKETSTIVVPSAIEGLSVTGIETGAFWSQRYAKIVLPDSIESIATASINAETIELGLGSGGGGASAVGDLLAGIADGAFASAGEVLLDYVLPAAALAALLAELAKLFSDLEAVEATASPDDGGHCGGSGLYMAGTTVKLTAYPNSGWRFGGWADGTPAVTRTITVPPAGASASYPANFIRRSSVTGVANPPEGGSVTGGGIYDVGTSVTLTATTNLYWQFIGWHDGYTNRSRAIIVPKKWE